MKHLADHITKLADQHRIEITYDPALPKRTGYSALRDGRMAILARPVEDETDYAVLLHEIGHHLHPTGRINKSSVPPHLLEARNWMDSRMEEERSAWAWARINALVWTPVMEADAIWAYGSYEKGQKQFLEVLEVVEMMDKILGGKWKNESQSVTASS